MESKDPYGFDDAKEWVSSDDGLCSIEKALKEAADKTEERRRNRTVSEKQWRQIFNL